MLDDDVGEAFTTAIDWLKVERLMYQGGKFDAEDDDDLTTERPEEWDRRIDMYLHRGRLLGLDNPLGRQAIAKAAATAVGYLESVFRVHNSIPAPGFPSGEVKGEMKLESS